MKPLSLGFAIEVVDICTVAVNCSPELYYLEAFLEAVAIYMVIAYAVIQIADLLEKALRVRM